MASFQMRNSSEIGADGVDVDTNDPYAVSPTFFPAKIGSRSSGTHDEKQTENSHSRRHDNYNNNTEKKCKQSRKVANQNAPTTLTPSSSSTPTTTTINHVTVESLSSSVANPVTQPRSVSRKRNDDARLLVMDASRSAQRHSQAKSPLSTSHFRSHVQPAHSMSELSSSMSEDSQEDVVLTTLNESIITPSNSTLNNNNPTLNNNNPTLNNNLRMLIHAVSKELAEARGHIKRLQDNVMPHHYHDNHQHSGHEADDNDSSSVSSWSTKHKDRLFTSINGEPETATNQAQGRSNDGQPEHLSYTSLVKLLDRVVTERDTEAKQNYSLRASLAKQEDVCATLTDTVRSYERENSELKQYASKLNKLLAPLQAERETSPRIRINSSVSSVSTISSQSPTKELSSTPTPSSRRSSPRRGFKPNYLKYKTLGQWPAVIIKKGMGYALELQGRQCFIRLTTAMVSLLHVQTQHEFRRWSFDSIIKYGAEGSTISIEFENDDGGMLHLRTNPIDTKKIFAALRYADETTPNSSPG